MLTFATIFVTSFVVALSGALMPGPLFTVTVSESSRRGAGAGPLLILGHGILELTLAAALMLGLANPYWTIWWVSIGLGYITHSLKVGIWGVAVFFAGHILADLAWYTAVSTAVWKGKRFMSDRFYRGLIGVCAVFLIVFAGLFGWAGVQRLL